MFDNEMILTEENISKAIDFIGASGFQRDDNMVTFFNVPSTKIIPTSKVITSHSTNGIFEYVSICIGNFIFVENHV